MRKPADMHEGTGRRPGKTRAAVLEAARGLFNARGVERVTTRLIADTVGINEGNLYYYFRTKKSLYLALFSLFEEEAAGLAAPRGAERGDLAAHADGLRRWFVLTWRYRFLFQDMMALQVAAPELRSRLRRLSVRLQTETRRSLSDLEQGGFIVLLPGLDEKLLANVWIVSSYWISYLVLHQRLQQVSEEHLRWGYGQVLSLYLPHLTESALAALAVLPEPSFSAESGGAAG